MLLAFQRKEMKRKSKKADKARRGKSKVSEMILDYANDFIGMGQGDDEKQIYLDFACIAWNISLLPKHEREEFTNIFISDYKDNNPNAHNIYCDKIYENIMILIKKKDAFYPDVKIHIVSAEIRNIDGQYHVTVASIDEEKKC